MLAIGDIHGCHVALDTLLEHLGVTANDTLVVLGDVIDRGPGTKQAIDRLIGLRERCRLVFVMGNHEEMFLDSFQNPEVREAWFSFGGFETISSYAESGGHVLDEHIAFLRTAVDFFETDAAVFVHANLEPGRPLAKQTAEWLRWIKLSKNEAPLPSGQRVVCGHTPQLSGLPWIGDGWVCIDTCAYGGLDLTVLDLTNDLVYQARQTGEFRGPVHLSECEARWGPASR